MPKTNADSQRAWRQRRAGRIAALEAEAAELRTEAGVLRGDLAAALGEAERLALTACRHPGHRGRRRDMPGVRHRRLVSAPHASSAAAQPDPPH